MGYIGPRVHHDASRAYSDAADAVRMSFEGAESICSLMYAIQNVVVLYSLIFALKVMCYQSCCIAREYALTYGDHPASSASVVSVLGRPDAGSVAISRISV